MLAAQIGCIITTKMYISGAYKQVMGKFMKRQPNGKRQTRELPEKKFDSS